jgi:DNA-directed RNA polymerase specialized sigma subunit
VRKGGVEGPGALILDDSLSSTFCEASESLEKLVINQANIAKLKAAMKNLSTDEKELITFVYFNGNTLKSYANLKSIGYSAAASKKTSILRKLKKALNMPSRKSYLN